MILLEVAVAAPLEAPLTYRLPESLLPDGTDGYENLQGSRVLVPLGKRKVTGYILGEFNGEVAFTVKNIIEILDAEPLVQPALIPFFKWIANYYHYPLGEVIKAALPAGISPKSFRQLVLPKEAEDVFKHSFSSSLPEWAEILLSNLSLSGPQTKRVESSKEYGKQLKKLLNDGVLQMQEKVSSETVQEKLETCYKLDKILQAVVPQTRQGSEKFTLYRKQLTEQTGVQFKLSEAKTVYYLHKLATGDKERPIPRRDLVANYNGASNGVRSLLDKKLVVQNEKRVFRSPLGDQLEHLPEIDNLSGEQVEALEKIKTSLKNQDFHTYLLHGVTGSGKTEVYLQAAKECLESGRAVLVLVPEIALATQLEAHFVSRFGNKVVLLHSGLTRGERFDQYYLALSGNAKIVIGARSAIFAPLADMGLIIVDEEHDAGLKQEDGLRYNGRDLAVVRAKMQGCVALLGSATPSVTSFHNGVQGKYTILTMEKRVGDRSLPEVTIIDLRKKDAAHGKGLFRQPLKEGIQKALQQNNQALILINRRGFSTSMICSDCGEPVKCEHCSVSLTFHRSSHQLLCHYCGYTIPSMTVCGQCGSTSLVPVGFGSERVEEELFELFPEANIARLDTDNARNRKSFLSILKQMRNGEIDILVGTQMVAKGHHFPGVSLVGVVWADGGLNFPDYKSAERTYQLIAQVTGRAGRGEQPGHVYIQTMRPDHYAIVLAQHHNYRTLVEKELDLRKQPIFPPFVRLAALCITGTNQEKVEKSARNLAGLSSSIIAKLPGKVEVLGPVPAPINKINSSYRWQLLLKGHHQDSLHGLCGYLKEHSREYLAAGCTMTIDVDPESMM